MAICGNCGQKLLPNVKFCSNCGTPVPAEVQAMNTGDGQAAAAAPATVATASTDTTAPVGKIQAGGKSFATIQAAIDGVAEGTEISIPAGNYNESIVVNKNVTLKGDGKNTIIHFKPSAYTDGSAVVKITSPCTIDNLCIQEDTNQNSVTYQPVNVDGVAALVLVYAEATLKNLVVKNGAIDGLNVAGIGSTIENCEFAYTYGVTFRGADSILTSDFNHSMKNCSVHHNQGIGIVSECSGGTFESCHVFENILGGASFGNCSPMLENCTFEKNGNGNSDESADEIHILANATPRFCNCTIRGNKGGCGVVIFELGLATFFNCKIMDNAMHGVLATGEGANSGFYDCDIFHNNQSDKDCAEVKITNGANPFFKKSGIYKNDVCGVLITDGGQGVFSCCEFKDNDEDVDDEDEACRFVNCDFEGGTDYNNADSEEDDDEDDYDDDEED